MILDGVLTQMEGACNRPIAHPLADEREHLMFTWSECLALGSRCGQAVAAPAFPPFPVDEESEGLGTCGDGVADAQRGIAPTGMACGDGPAHYRGVVHLKSPASDESTGGFVLDGSHGRVEAPFHGESAPIFGEMDIPVEGSLGVHSPTRRGGDQVDEPVGQGRQGLHTGKCGTGIGARERGIAWGTAVRWRSP